MGKRSDARNKMGKGPVMLETRESLGGLGLPHESPCRKYYAALRLHSFLATLTRRMGANQAFWGPCLSFPSQEDLREDWNKEQVGHFTGINTSFTSHKDRQKL